MSVDVLPEPMEVEEENSLRPIAILIDELAEDDIQIRIGALKQVTRIASALGAERTRNELIPYITSMLEDDDDVLRIICEVLFQLIDLIGGQEHLHNLIQPYEILCVVEENSIRNLALEKLAIIISRIPSNLMLQHLPHLFDRLFQSEWHTARTAAAGIAPHIFARLQGSEHEEKIKTNFLQLAKDNMPQVRRSVAENLAPFAKHMPQIKAEQIIFPVLVHLADDPQDSVRVRALEGLIEVGFQVKAEQSVTQLRFSIRSLCMDPSWRVRFLASSKFTRICQRLETKDHSMLDLFLKLLKDAEAEVRAAASSQLPDMSANKFISQEVIINKFVPLFKELTSDTNKYTRAHFAEVLVPLGSHYSKQFVTEHILPLILILLKDPEPQPRLNCLSHLNLDVVNPKDVAEALLPCIKELASDESWRVRKNVLQKLPGLSARLGPDIVDKDIKKIVFNLMCDEVHSVRQSTAQIIKEICEKMNDEKWTKQTLTQIFEQTSNSSYLKRQTFLEAIKHLAEALPSQLDPCIDKLLTFINDKVPNVRLKLCTVLLELVSQISITKEIQLKIVNELLKLREDKDPDVSFFAEKTLNHISQNSSL